MSKIIWQELPEDHDYEAATSYLSLVMSVQEAKKIINALQAADVAEFKAKDILRASRLPLLGNDNHHVKHDLKKITDGVALSPILLVRGDAISGTSLTIADGYHRVCAIESLNEDLPIRCKIV